MLLALVCCAIGNLGMSIANNNPTEPTVERRLMILPSVTAEKDMFGLKTPEGLPRWKALHSRKRRALGRPYGC
jgi:hypothetical protein